MSNANNNTNPIEPADDPGLQCPRCKGTQELRITQTRRRGHRIKRHRRCVCGHRFITWEMNQAELVMIIAMLKDHLADPFKSN